MFELLLVKVNRFSGLLCPQNCSSSSILHLLLFFSSCTQNLPVQFFFQVTDLGFFFPPLFLSSLLFSLFSVWRKRFNGEDFSGPRMSLNYICEAWRQNCLESSEGFCSESELAVCPFFIGKEIIMDLKYLIVGSGWLSWEKLHISWAAQRTEFFSHKCVNLAVQNQDRV